MNFWKEHASLRMIAIAGLFLAGLILIIWGWTMTGKLAGLGIMILGVILLLTALFIYNKPYTGSDR
ncbi:MAG: hypothetical protein Q4F83_03540 [Eubacteriales bacterium]|nr:hypothetical protein [Eubacteriales bacterium]